MLVYAEEDGDDCVADSHSDGSGKHNRSAAEFVNVENSKYNVSRGHCRVVHVTYAGMVAKNIATPTTPVARRLVVLLEVPRAAKIEGA